MKRRIRDFVQPRRDLGHVDGKKTLVENGIVETPAEQLGGLESEGVADREQQTQARSDMGNDGQSAVKLRIKGQTCKDCQ